MISRGGLDLFQPLQQPSAPRFLLRNDYLTLVLVLLFLLTATEHDSSLALIGGVTAFLPSSSLSPHSQQKQRRSVPTDWVVLALSSSRQEAAAENDAQTQARKWKEQAERLRKEIASFESSKETLQQNERTKQQESLNAQQAVVDHYSATVPILKADGETVLEQVQFPPAIGLAGDNVDDAVRTTTEFQSTIVTVEAPLPLGILLGESENLPGRTVVDEVASGSNGEQAGIQEGDIVRGCTACRMEMNQQATWQLLAGGIGRPKTMRFMFSCDFCPFEEVMEALGSNRMDPEERAVLLVLERPISR